MLTLYTDTWGSDQDWLTAFAAGFLGKVVIDWSGLAVFRPLWGWWQERGEDKGKEDEPPPAQQSRDRQAERPSVGVQV